MGSTARQSAAGPTRSVQQEHRESEERGPREQRQCDSRPELLIERQLLSKREGTRELPSRGKSDVAAEESEGSETETDCAKKA